MDPKKNILLLIDSFAYPGGTQKLLCDLGKVLSKKYNVFECSFNAFEENHVFKNDNKVLSLGVCPPVNVFQKLTGYVLKAFRLNMLKRRHKIDITISNLWPADFVNVLSMGRGKIVSHGVVNVVGNYQNRMMLEYRKVTGWIYRRFHKVVSINNDLMDELAGIYNLLPSRSSCIYPFVGTPDIGDLHPAFSTPRKRMVWFGRLNRIKNLNPLFTIFARLKSRIPNVQLIVIGEGPHREELLAAARDADLNISDTAEASEADVIFLGFVPNPYLYLKECDLFVLTSKSEGFGLVIVEAMSVGLPVLASDCPTGGPHLIMEGMQPYCIGRTKAEETPYGYLLPVPEPGDSTTAIIWEDAIVELLNDEIKRTRKGANGICRAADFSIDRIKGQWFELLDSI